MFFTFCHVQKQFLPVQLKPWLMPKWKKNLPILIFTSQPFAARAIVMGVTGTGGVGILSSSPKLSP